MPKSQKWAVSPRRLDYPSKEALFFVRVVQLRRQTAYIIVINK